MSRSRTTSLWSTSCVNAFIPLIFRGWKQESGLERGVYDLQTGARRLSFRFSARPRTLTMCPKWTFVKAKVFRAGLESLTVGWMFSFRNFSMYIPKKGQTCSKIWTSESERSDRVVSGAFVTIYH